MNEPEPVIIALVRDLMFSSKITATARAQGRSVRIVREPAALAREAGSMLLADLNLPGAVEASADWMARTSGQAVGFVSHVDAETIALARQAGLTRVMPRSRFVQDLPTLLDDGTVGGCP
jgi:hypothetical protein